MPAKTGKQYRLMAMIAHGKRPTGKNGKPIGPSEEVAEEMVHKTPPKKRSLFMKRKG
jgi:hypothetical protein